MSFKTSYIYDLVDKMSPQLTRINNSLQKTTDKIKKTADKSSKSFRKIGNSLDNTAKKAGALGRSLFLILSISLGLIAGSFIKTASDAEETSSKFATVFQDISKESERTAKNLADNFGLSSTKAKELLSNTGDLLSGFGFTGESALDLSKQVNELAVDLASFTNFTGGAEGASQALTKALLGERESVKSLGISILEEDVKAKIKSLKATGQLTGMTERQAKAYATLQIAVSQSKNAIGDFARTSESFANQTRIFSAKIHDLRIGLGEILLPLAVKFIKKIADLTDKFNALSPSTKKTILVLSGLAIAIPPILISIALVATSIKGLTVLVKRLAISLRFLALNPIGLVISGLALVIVSSKTFRKDFINVITFTIKKAMELFGFFGDKIDFVASKLAKFLENFGIDFGFGKGQELDKILQQQRRELAFKVEKNQSVDVGGILGININAPQGTNANFTPANNNPVGTKINFTQTNPLLN